MRLAKTLIVVCSLVGLARAEILTLPMDQRPAWLGQDGIVMAGSWEPLPFRVRRDGGTGHTPTAEELAAYTREHSPEMIARLKAIGVNFVMMHCYKGCGLQTERESMADAVRFAKLCHQAGLRVGVYNYSGAFLWEPFFKEMPQAREWVLLDAGGKPVPYSSNTRYRYFWNRNHPDAKAFYRGLIQFAVEDIQTDLIHFDNYDHGPGTDANSVERFCQYLSDRLTPQQRQAMGITDIAHAEPPVKGPAHPLRRVWLDFTSQSLADSYADMCRYARGLRKDILVECNPGGPCEAIRSPVDHGRLLQGGEAFWDEGFASGYRDGTLQTRIRTYKIARAMNNTAFAYTLNPLEAAEAMAFNLDCLGCICWFEYADIVNRPGAKDPVSPALVPYIEFFHKHRDLLRDAAVVADAAVLRSFPSQALDDGDNGRITARAEQSLIEGRVPFQIIYDHQLVNLAGYRVLVLAGCVAMSDAQVGLVRRFVEKGGHVCIVGPAATHDEWIVPRNAPALDNLPANRLTRLTADDDLVAAVRRACPDGLAVSVEAPAGVCVELTRQKHRQLVHLVNYRPDVPAEKIRVHLRVPAGTISPRVTLVSPDGPSPNPNRERGNAVAEVTRQPGAVEFAVPSLKVYTIAVVEDR